MPGDDNEKDALPPHVEKALAAARTAVKSDKQSGTRGGRWLALVPVTAAVVFFALLMPRATEPRDIPMPALDGKALRATIDADRARAAAAKTNRLPGEVLAVGTAIRALNKTSTRTGPDAPYEVERARQAVDDAKLQLGKDAVEQLLSLRAIQLEEFLVEVSRFESTGQETPELVELGANFIARMREATWIDGNRVVLDEAERRAAYKMVWNAIANMGGGPFALTVDEERALYTLYIAHPHVSDAQRPIVLAELAQAKGDDECARARANERRLVELWRADKIQKLSALDPSYPTAYALGVAYYRAGRYETSIEQFRRWIDAHPDGPYSLRARNHLRAALLAYGDI